MHSYIATVLQFNANILEKLIRTVFQVTQNCSTLLTMCKWKGTIDQCDRHFKQSLSRDGLCCSFNYYTFPDTTTLDKYKHYFCRTEREFWSFTKDFKIYTKNKFKKMFFLISKKWNWDKKLFYDLTRNKNRKKFYFSYIRIKNTKNAYQY